MKQNKNTTSQSYLGLAIFFPASFSVIMILVYLLLFAFHFGFSSHSGSYYLFIGGAGM